MADPTIQDGYGALRRVYVRPPRAEDAGAWDRYGWHAAPDPGAAASEHDRLRAILEETGADVIVGSTPVPGDPDAIYAYDPILPTDDGVVLLRPGKEGRRGEPAAHRADLEAAGLGILATIEPPGTAEGGDMCFLDRGTLLVGLGYRTNEAALEQLRGLLRPRGIQIHAFDLPHFHGPAECLHLLSFLSPLDEDLVVGYLPMMPVRLVQLLREREVAIVEVPDEEFGSMGPNVLALGPRTALALEGNTVTAERMRAAGVDVRTYRGEEISRKGDGGPTCLTRPLLRG
jgi:N-dimethylarginine dimethylaminohydrolase